MTIGISSSTKVIKSYPLATLTVYLASTTTLATIYSTVTGAAQANPMTTGADASWAFYADAGAHLDLRFSGTGITTPFTIADVVVTPDSGISPATYGGNCDGVTNSTAAWTTMFTALGSTPTRIVIGQGCQYLLSTITIPANIILDFTAGGSIKVVTGQTVTIQGDIWASSKCFYNAQASQGTVSILSYVVKDVRPEW